MTRAGSALTREAALAGAVACAAFLPFLRGVASGASLYFRDLSLQFFPVRRFAAEGLRAGTLRYWNPYAYEGTPLSPLPLGYPVDLLQALRPDEASFSLLLVLHLPLAALAAYLLARHLGSQPAGAVAGALVFSLSGYALSTVNLYVYAQALPWAALLVVALARAAAGGGRRVALAALAGALLLSTTGVETALQAVIAGLLLLPCPPSRRGAARLAGVLALSVGLAAVVIGPAAALVAGSARGAGFPTAVVLAHSVHPIGLLQTVVAGLFADPASPVDRYWGMSFFPRGFPYLLSLYLGATALALAGTGLGERRAPRWRLLGLAVGASIVCLGRWVGLAPLVDALGPLHTLRFPVKAFFTVQLAVALLASFGLSAVARGERRALRIFTALSLGAGLVVGLAPALALALPASRQALLVGFFPPELAWAERAADARAIAVDAARGGSLAVAAGLVALLARRGRARATLAAGAIAVLLAIDLLRAGAGLNPMLPPDFLRPSPQMQAVAARLRAEGGRLCPLDASYSPAYHAARAQRSHHELWSFAVVQETLTPDTNLRSGVPTALTPDRTMLVPSDRVLAPELAGPDSVPRLLPGLREAGVTHLLSLDNLEAAGLAPEAVVTPSRIAPLAIRLYRLEGAAPLAELEGPGRVVSLERHGDRTSIEVEAERPGRLVWREATAEGWSVFVDDRQVPVERFDRRHLAVPVPAGRHVVEPRYRPPRFGLWVSVSAASALVLVGLLLRRGPPRGPRP